MVLMLLGEKAEEGNFEPSFLGGSASDQRRQLVVVADKDKFVCESQWTETGGKGNLRSFIDDAVVESTSGEQSAIKFVLSNFSNWLTPVSCLLINRETGPRDNRRGNNLVLKLLDSHSSAPR